MCAGRGVGQGVQKMGDRGMYLDLAKASGTFPPRSRAPVQALRTVPGMPF